MEKKRAIKTTLNSVVILVNKIKLITGLHTGTSNPHLPEFMHRDEIITSVKNFTTTVKFQVLFNELHHKPEACPNIHTDVPSILPFNRYKKIYIPQQLPVFFVKNQQHKIFTSARTRILHSEKKWLASCNLASSTQRTMLVNNRFATSHSIYNSKQHWQSDNSVFSLQQLRSDAKSNIITICTQFVF